MLRKQTANKSGFTIIEVVITIAIGAAVMALVLNAVAGARRSQRNNARASDVNQVASAVNQYIATRNALPTEWSQISPIIDAGDKFGHFEPSSINPVTSWGSLPATGNAGDFIDGNAFAVGGKPLRSPPYLSATLQSLGPPIKSLSFTKLVV